MNVVQSPNKDKLMAEVFPKNNDKEHQEMSQNAKDSVTEQGSHDHKRSAMQFVLQLRNSWTYENCECGLIGPRTNAFCVSKLERPEAKHWQQHGLSFVPQNT